MYHDLGLPVLWIEACPSFAPRLANALDAYEDQDFRIAALSDRPGSVRRFYLSNNSDGISSSLKDFGPDAKRMWPSLGLHHVSDLPVVTTTLDHLISGEAAWVAANQPTTLILDVQGSEFEVLQGAAGSLWRFDNVIVEVSSVNVYRDSLSEKPVHDFLLSFGFERKDYSAHVEGHGDAFYVRSSFKVLDCKPENVPDRVIDDIFCGHADCHALINPLHSVLEFGSEHGGMTEKLLDLGCLVTSIGCRPGNVRDFNRRLSLVNRRRWIGYAYNSSLHLPPEGLRYDCLFAYNLRPTLHAQEKLFLMIDALEPSFVILEFCLPSTRDVSNPGFDASCDGDQLSAEIVGMPARQLILKRLQELFPSVYSSSGSVEYDPFAPERTQAIDAAPSGYTYLLFVGSAEPLLELGM